MDEVETAVEVLRPRDLDNPELMTESLQLLTDASSETLERYRDVVGEKWYRSNVTSLSFKFKSLSIENPIKNDVVYSTLYGNQRSVFKKLHTAISESYNSKDQFVVTRPKILVLDSPSGTGKSFLLKLLSMTLDEQIISIEYSLALTHMMELYGDVASCTHRRFFVRVTNKSIEEVINTFRGNDVSDEDCLTRALSLWNEAIIARHELNNTIGKPVLLILDEYTRFSPWFIYFLLVYVYAKRINLLFVGDRYQLDPIDRTNYHDANNHTIVSYMADQVFKLPPGQIRKRDKLLHSLISIFQKELDFPDVVPMSFKYAYLVYDMFPEKFFLPEELEDNLYFAHYHDKIAERTLRLLDYIEDTKIEDQDWHKAPYYMQVQLTPDEEEIMEPMDMDDVSHKFLPFLLLIKGCRYFYIEKSRGNTKTVVRYLSLGSDDKLIVMDEEEDDTFTLSRVNLIKNYWFDARVRWLKKQAWKMIPRKAYLYGIWQYPLIPYCSTYHAAQSLEILDDETIELDLDVPHANSIYVGLTRIRNSSQLGKIHSELLPSLILTHYFDDNYYYKIDPSTHEDYCDRLEEETRTFYENHDSSESDSEFGYSSESDSEFGYSSESDSEFRYSSDLPFNIRLFKTVKNVQTFDEYKGMCRIKRSMFDRKVPTTAKVTELMRLCRFVRHVFTKEGAAAAKIYNYRSFCDKYTQWKLKN